MVSNMEHLDQIADSYHTNKGVPDIHIENLCQEHFVRWLLDQIPAGARVLELGYGDGIVTEALAKHGVQLTLIEGAAKLVTLARQRHPEIECVHTLFETFAPPLPFDVILASHVLEHVDEPGAILHGMVHWLAPLGRVVVVVPNRNSIHRVLAVEMGLQPALDTLSNRDLLVGHQRVYSLPALIDDVVSAGLEVVMSRGFFLKVLPNSMMLGFPTALLDALNTISPILPQELLANIAVVARKAEGA